MKKVLLFIVCIFSMVSCYDHVDFNETYIIENTETQLFDNIIWDGEYQVLQLANGQTMYMDRDSTFFLGDIIFSKEQIEKMNTPQSRAVVTEPYVQYWPDKKIYYFISPGFESIDVLRINHALTTLENTVCIDFVPSLSMSASPCITFALHPKKNSSPVGMNSTKRNTINLKSGVLPSTVIHEVMHSLGFFHEQSRNDRDEYVIVYSENVEDGKLHNFTKIVDMELQAMNLSPFDYESIMIYDSEAFAITEGTYTMTKLDGSLIPRTTQLSDYDKAALNFIYGPKPILTTTEIFSDYFHDNNSIDENIRYSNVITFQDMSGQPVALTYPRLLVINYYKRTKVGELIENDVEISNVIYQTVPAGATQYVLPNTEYVRQEDMGINRYYQNEIYSVEIY